MTMSRQGAVPRVPTPPRGDEIATYATYLEAQKAVDYLSDRKFAVEAVTIVGTDLRMVERVTGRLTYGRVAVAGAISGAWFGLFVGVLMTFFAEQAGYALMVLAIALGAAFGLLFSILSYAITGGRRDFTSSSQIVASRYSILCAPERARDARQMLDTMPGGAGIRQAPANPTWGAPTGPAGGGSAPNGSAPNGPSAGQGFVPGVGPGAGQAPGAGAVPGSTPSGPTPAPAPARPLDSRWTLPDGTPRYGALQPKDPAAPVAPTATPTPAPDRPVEKPAEQPADQSRES